MKSVRSDKNPKLAQPNVHLKKRMSKVSDFKIGKNQNVLFANLTRM